MNTPVSRMSTWDIPHVPPAPEPTSEETSAPPDAGENTPPQEGPSAPLSRREPESPPTAQVRFLNGVLPGGKNLRIATENRLLSSSLAPGSLSEYFPVAAGFRPFAFYDETYPWLLLFRSTIPLTAGDEVTLALVRSGAGVDLVRVDDRPCGIQNTHRACLRCVNLVHNSPGLDLVLTDGRVVFTDVRFKEVTNYRRAQPGRYDLYVARTPALPPVAQFDMETVEELPMVALNWMEEPLASLFLDLRSGGQVSLYLLGDWDADRALRILSAENF